MRFLPVLLLSGALCAQEKTTPLQLEWGPDGLKALRYADHDWLADGKLHVEGEKGTTSVEKTSILRTFSWGSVRGDYAAVGTQLQITLTVSNRSDKPIDRVQLNPLHLRLPAKS